jgi:hypothetical protein
MAPAAQWRCPARLVTTFCRYLQPTPDPLLQVRCAVYNGALGSGFLQEFHPANDPPPQAAIAA